MMEDPGFHRRPKHKPTYLMVPRKFMIAMVTSFVCMLALSVASIQWANFVDKRSNQRWCKIVILFNEGYKDNPPTTKLGKELAIAMRDLQEDFYCKNT